MLIVPCHAPLDTAHFACLRARADTHGIHHGRARARLANLTVLLLARPAHPCGTRAHPYERHPPPRSLVPVPVFQIARALAPLAAGQGFSVPLDAAAKC